jgi:hypothetical protein
VHSLQRWQSPRSARIIGKVRGDDPAASSSSGAGSASSGALVGALVGALPTATGVSATGSGPASRGLGAPAAA